MKGRGTALNPENPFSSTAFTKEHSEGVDDWQEERRFTQSFFEKPKKILSKNNSPDLSFDWSINPYQGCEHGCVYCYARNTHAYWGFNIGLDFESKIVVKKNAAELLEKEFNKDSWKSSVIMLSGNTDCYQPLEKKHKITRSLLKVIQKYGNPVSIVTKNALVLRDLDILSDLAKENLVKVIFSITSLNEKLRSKLEPRTSAIHKKFRAMEILSERKIPVGVLMGPIIPGLNDHEIPTILKLAGECGASKAGYTSIRLNGQLDELFEKFMRDNFPERANKVLSQIRTMHGGNLNDSKWGRRMKGEGNWSNTIHDLFNVSMKKYIPKDDNFRFDLNRFRRNGNMTLF
jgi:DNA repair photolyase